MHVLKTIGKSVREYKTPSVLAPIFIVVEVVMETVIPMIMSKLIDEFANGMNPVLKYGAILLAMAVASLVSGMLAARYAAKAATGLSANLRKDMFYSIQDFSFREIDGFSVSSLVTRMTTDVTNVQNAYQMIIRGAIRTPLMLIFAFAMAFSLNWKIALCYLAAVPIVGAALFLIVFKVMPYFRRSFRRYDAMNASIQENVRAIRVVKSFVTEEYEKQKFAKHVEEVKNDFVRAEKILALNSPVMMFSIYAIIMIIAAFGSQMIINSQATELTTGELTALIGYAGQILGSMMMLSMIMVMISMSIESAKRITEVLDTETTIVSPEDGVKEVIPDAACEAYDLIKNDMADMRAKINSCDACAIGSPTLNSDAVPPVWDLLAGVDAINSRKKPVAVFGSYGWSGEAVPNLIARVNGLKMAVVGEGFKVCFVPTAEDLAAAKEYGKQLASALK